MPAPYARRDAFQSLARAVNRTAPGQAQGRFRGLRSTSTGVGGGPTHADPAIAAALDFSFIQGWSITDDATDTFTLDYLPIEDSWNLELNGLRVHRSEFTISDQTLTIASPTDLFRGADTQGTPWDLEIQYDCTLEGVAASPSIIPYHSEWRYYFTSSGEATGTKPDVGFDDSGWGLGSGGFGHDYGSGGGLSPTWLPIGVDDLNSAVWLRGPVGYANSFVVTVRCDDDAAIWWNGTFVSSVPGPTEFGVTIPSILIVPGEQQLTVKGANGGGNFFLDVMVVGS